MVMIRDILMYMDRWVAWSSWPSCHSCLLQGVRPAEQLRERLQPGIGHLQGQGQTPDILASWLKLHLLLNLLYRWCGMAASGTTSVLLFSKWSSRSVSKMLITFFIMASSWWSWWWIVCRRGEGRSSTVWRSRMLVRCWWCWGSRLGKHSSTLASLCHNSFFLPTFS